MLLVPFNYGLVGLATDGSQKTTRWVLPGEDLEGVEVPDGNSPVVYLLSEFPTVRVLEYDLQTKTVLKVHVVSEQIKEVTAEVRNCCSARMRSLLTISSFAGFGVATQTKR